MLIYSDMWWYVVIHCDKWRYIMIYADMWWYNVINGDKWWYMLISHSAYTSQNYCLQFRKESVHIRKIRIRKTPKGMQSLVRGMFCHQRERHSPTMTLKTQKFGYKAPKIWYILYVFFNLIFIWYFDGFYVNFFC